MVFFETKTRNKNKNKNIHQNRQVAIFRKRRGKARMALSRPTRAGLSTTAHPAIAMLQKRFSGRFCEIHSPDFLAEHLPGQLVSLGVNLDC